MANPDGGARSGAIEQHLQRGPVVQRDGGRVPEQEEAEEAAEIPPTYDSLPEGDRR